uniref:Uncharacterized protein n=1 Tax=Candidatus Kentrum sp. TC TaxID=2126339 RepID=A0A450Z7B3_9GAMM|nr:MAG: hypothetical protein BECKTC1821E_GA0114239_11693 [Candidatus Kentron sp. TC]VFK49568.1 MAG: hypothetical protein BECKTC1821D_GA0114238_10818 [Candidatus Kentron sp. TC]VFK65189.1 MAG: hypothetical protein BECKTC1821F_GA0114240_11703 [Candidatus Kentron sp. TC]
MLLSHPIVKILNGNNPLLGAKNAQDIMAIANTYIVFTTFIFVLLTIAITGAGIWFARWFGISKEKEIRENMRDFFEEIDSDSKLSKRFAKELFKHKEISNELHRLVQSRVESELAQRATVNFSNKLTEDTGQKNE